MVSCGLNNENMELKQRIIRNLEWANKRLGLQGKELDETQLEIIEFCLLHDLQQLTIQRVSCCICETPNPEKIHGIIKACTICKKAIQQ